MSTSIERQRVYELLSTFETTMMVTHAPSGPFDCRPMHIADSEIESGGPIWFISSTEGRKTREIGTDPKTLLTFQDGRRYLTIWGRAEIVDDRTRLARIWKPSYDRWAPSGTADPTIRLIKFVPHSAEYWDNSGDTPSTYFDAPATEPLTVEDETPERHGRTVL
jgi:general stress protein 26